MNRNQKYSVSWLIQEIAKGKEIKLHLFYGHKPSFDGQITDSCLSQWWMANFQTKGITYCCMEQFMMAQKAALFRDDETFQRILNCQEPQRIKSLGRQVRGFSQSTWDQWKYPIVRNGNWYKFSQNPPLKNFLLSTGDVVLAEASPYDPVWGIGLSKQSPFAANPTAWQGKNLLGFALMEVRDALYEKHWQEIIITDNQRNIDRY